MSLINENTLRRFVDKEWAKESYDLAVNPHKIDDFYQFI